MKRYLLFAGHIYPPRGGWEDLIKAFDTFDEAQAGSSYYRGFCEWYHIVDAQGGTIVEEGLGHGPQVVPDGEEDHEADS